MPSPVTIDLGAAHAGSPPAALGAAYTQQTYGIRIVPGLDITVTALRFYGVDVMNNPRVSVWRVADGVKMGGGTFAGNSVIGWNQLAAAAPFLLAAGEAYYLACWATGTNWFGAHNASLASHTHTASTEVLTLPGSGASSNTDAAADNFPVNAIAAAVEPWLGLVGTPANTAPGAPVLTAPNGGEVIDASKTITWTAATDPDGDALVYDLDYSANNGASWTAITVGAAGLAYVWNTSALPNGASYLVRVRARDTSGAAGPFDQSNAVFSIAHNVAPTPASGLSPDGGATVDRNSVQRLAWTFNDPNAGDTQSKFDLRWRVGVGAWTTITQTATTPFYDMPAGTFPAGSVEWQVLTYDALGLPATGWSASAFLTAASTPGAPAITAPVNNSTQATPTGAITWSTPAQDDYQVRKVADSAGAPDTATIYYDTGTVAAPAARDAALDFPVNNRTEHLQLRIRTAGLWSSWASVKVNVAYSAPAVPTLVATPAPAAASIDVAVTHPAPVSPQPAVASTELWRREAGDTGAGERLKLSVVGGAYRDVTPASGVAYEYQAVAIGTTGTKQASAWTP